MKLGKPRRFNALQAVILLYALILAMPGHSMVIDATADRAVLAT
jgi:hypothetical protein